MGEQLRGWRQRVQVRGSPEGAPKLGWPLRSVPPCQEVGSGGGTEQGDTQSGQGVCPSRTGYSARWASAK